MGKGVDRFFLGIFFVFLNVSSTFADADALKQLIREDPEEALSSPLKSAGTFISGIGRLDVQVACGFGLPGHVDHIERFACIDGVRYEVLTFGKGLDLNCTDDLPMQGVAVDGVMALDEKPPKGLKVPAGSSGGKSGWTEGAKTLLYLRVDYPDLPGDPAATAEVTNWMQVVSEFMEENSDFRMLKLLQAKKDLKPHAKKTT